MKKQELSWQGEVLRIHYPALGKTLQFDTSKYPASVQVDARKHGFKQKFGDAESGGTPQEKYDEAMLIDASLRAGEWTRTAKPDPTPMILQAVARIRGLKVDLEKRTLTRVKDGKVVKPSVDALKKWGSDAAVKAMVLKIKAERAAKLAEESDDEVEIEGLDD